LEIKPKFVFLISKGLVLTHCMKVGATTWLYLLTGKGRTTLSYGPYTLRSHGVIPTTPNAKQGLLDVKFLT